LLYMQRRTDIAEDVLKGNWVWTTDKVSGGH
jgi:hypothetical protein